MKAFILGLALFGFALPIAAQAASNQSSLVVSLTGMLSSHEEISSSSDINKNHLSYGGGVLIEAVSADDFGIETGVLVRERNYEASFAGKSLGQRVKRIHIPILARAWLTDYFSVAVGPFASFKAGSVDTYLKIDGSEMASYSTDAERDLEYGVDGALTFNIAVADKTGLFVEARYSEVLSSDEVDGDISALSGIKIDL